MNIIQVQLFGCLIDAVGAANINVEEANDLQSLREKILCAYPSLQKFSFVTALNKKIEKGNAVLNEKSMVALMPPFSGG
jgi:molybdopterin converting factor small subunit